MPNAAALSGPSAHRHHATEALRCSLRADRWRRAAVAARDGGASLAVVEDARDRAAFWVAKASKHDALGAAALRGWERCLGCDGSGMVTGLGTAATVRGLAPVGALCGECDAEGYTRAEVAATAVAS